MNPFLAAQAVDPFDLVSMLIHADWLEEHGDATGAAVLRALAEGGTPSLHAMALQAALQSGQRRPDRFEAGLEYGLGTGLEDGTGLLGRVRPGPGFGLGDGTEDRTGSVIIDQFHAEVGDGVGDRYALWGRHNDGNGGNGDG